VEGSYRFLNRIWKLVQDNLASIRTAGAVCRETLTDEGRDLRRAIHKTIRKVTDDVEERFHFNTAIAAVMELANTVQAFGGKADPANGPVLREALESIILMLSPFVPHVTAELWQRIGSATPLDAMPWPSFDADAARDEELLIVVQVNGKLRGKVTVAAGADEAAVRLAVMGDTRVCAALEGKTIRKEIYVPGKLFNIVVA
jgi:leucyl-tRNA synthetase